MKKYLFLCYFVLVSLASFGQKNLCGTYRTNFATYGMFGKTLTLNQDSSAIMKFQGDLMLDYSIGKWSCKDNILTITFDSLTYPTQRYKGQDTYVVKRNKLETIFWTTNRYNELKKQVELHNKTNEKKIELPNTYKKFVKKYNATVKVPKNFLGKQRRQYLKKIPS